MTFTNVCVCVCVWGGGELPTLKLKAVDHIYYVPIQAPHTNAMSHHSIWKCDGRILLFYGIS